MNEAYQTIRNNFIQNEELKRLEELKNKYANFQQPDYSTMSTHDELQTRFDLNELNDLQQKYANSLKSIYNLGENVGYVIGNLKAAKEEMDAVKKRWVR